MTEFRHLVTVACALFGAPAAMAQDAPEKPAAAVAQPADDLEPAVSGASLADAARPAANKSAAVDELDLGRTEITGNQELPRVLYIVPWQKSDPGDLLGRPVNTLLDEVLAPLDREEFIRQVDYYSDLNEPQDE